MGDPKINWFGRFGTGYVLAKYGMTLLTHGMAEELADYGIGCNTLWPRTAIATAAVAMVMGNEAMNGSRTDEIMADAAHVIISSDSRTTTDQFFIDDEVLVSVGVKDFQKYKVNPKVADHDLVTDILC